MKVIFYTRPCFFDLALSHSRALSNYTELHLVMELSPESWNSALFDVSPKKIASGIVDGDEVLHACFPEKVRRYWRACASFNLLVHNCPKSIHPATWQISYRAMQFCLSITPDVIHFDDISLRAAWGLWRLRKIPIVLSVHDPEVHTGEKNWRNELARRLTFPFVNRFILHSSGFKNAFMNRNRLSSQQVHSHPLGVYNIYREWIQDPLQEDEKTILFFGRMSPYKGLEVLFNAAPLVAKKVNGVRFVIAGRPIKGYQLPKRPALDRGAKIQVLSEYVSNKHLAELFQRATVVVCPYTDATQSGVVLTAYAFGKPVVATNTGGLPEYVRDGVTGLMVEPGNHNQLADALIKILTEKELKYELKKEIVDIAKKDLCWEKIAQQTVATYSEVITG